jgi:hypothetical protein
MMYCKNCGYEEDFDFSSEETNCLYSNNYSNDRTLFYKFIVNPYTKYDKTLPKIDIPCQNETCKSHGDKKSNVIYIKYDKKDLKYLYLCCVCDTYWTFDNKDKA